ncbi:hypothetical protein KZ844_29395, partial [Pseudomonas aeruginosa]|nr:hypothetical protein [Pseudomonas aeruginosa]
PEMSRGLGDVYKRQSLGRESGAGESLEALCQRCVALDESTRTQPQARQQAAYEQAYRRYLEHLPPR